MSFDTTLDNIGREHIFAVPLSLSLEHFVFNRLSYFYYRTQWNTGGSFLAPSVCFFVCVWNISGTAERSCAKFTRKTCVIPLSEEFEGQGQRSKVRVTRDKTGFSADISGTARPICAKFTEDMCLGPIYISSEGIKDNDWGHWIQKLYFRALLVACVWSSRFINNRRVQLIAATITATLP